MRRKDNIRRFLLSAALAALSLSACASAPPQVETITIDGEDLIMDISEEKAFSFDCQPADAQREELALKAPAQLGAELEDEQIIIDPDAEGTFTLYLQSDAVTSNAITVTVIDSARIEAEKQAEEEARRREEAERQKAQEEARRQAEAAAQAEAAQQAQQEQAASQSTPASGGNAQTPVQASVYIAASGNGTKYHSDPHCSRMNGVIEMSVEEAQAMGYTPCKKCY